MRNLVFTFVFALVLVFTACQSGGSGATGDKTTALDSIKLAEAALKSDQSGNFDVAKAKTALTAYEKFIALAPKDAETSEYLFKSAEIYRSLRQFDKAIEAYQRIITDFPNYDKTPHSLFLMGFCYENDMGQKDKAKPLYEEFLKKYPQHELAQSVQFSLSNIDKTPEQIIKEFEAKSKDKSADKQTPTKK
jgi:tetratricopeptide (TPR) repeat protein